MSRALRRMKSIPNFVFHKWRERFGILRHLPHQSSQCQGKALVSYLLPKIPRSPEVIKAYLRTGDKTHFAYWDSLCWGWCLAELGYDVDFMDFNDVGQRAKRSPDLVQKKLQKYDVILDLHRLWGSVYLPNATKKIMHVTGSYTGYSNRREIERVDAFNQRKNSNYKPKRLADEHVFIRGLQVADAVTMIGNNHTKSTYPYDIQKKTTLVGAGYIDCQELDRSKITSEMCKHYLWFAGGGAVHKGLDIALDYFMKRPDLHLHVVGGAFQEKDFASVYDTVNKVKNIHCHGFMPPNSQAFRDVILQCAFFISLACSEGVSTSALTALRSGLYPLMTIDTNVDVDEGTLITDLTVDALEEAIRQTQSLKPEAVGSIIGCIQKQIQQTYGLEAYKARIEKFLVQFLNA